MLLTGLTYNYAVNPVTVALGDNAQRTIATTGRVNVAAVVSITSGPVTRETTGSALEDGTYGDFGAGLYGTSTLGTVLSQIPLAVGLQPGWRIDLAGVTGGSLTIGLTADVIAQARNAPGAIVMTMDKSGLQIPTASGLIDGYNKAQVATTTLTLVNGGTSLTSVLGRVWRGGHPPVPPRLRSAHVEAAVAGRVAPRRNSPLDRFTGRLIPCCRFGESPMRAATLTERAFSSKAG